MEKIEVDFEFERAVKNIHRYQGFFTRVRGGE